MADEESKEIIPYTLTEEDKKTIQEKMEEVAQTNETVKNVLAFPSNNGVEEHIPEQGYEQKMMINVDPESGEQTAIGPANTEEESHSLTDMGDAFNEFDPKNMHFDVSDIQKATKDASFISSGSDYHISDDTCLELLKLINEKKDNDNAKITYGMLPVEIKAIIDKYLLQQGVTGYGVSANTFRNEVASMLIDEYISNIGMNKSIDSFNTEIENMYKDAGKEISPLIKEYNDSKLDMLSKACENVTDPEKKVTIEKTLDAINDAYHLSRIIDSGKKFKIKNYDYENPDRVFSDFLFKYAKNNNHIYDLNMVLKVLVRHLDQNEYEDSYETAIKFLLIFCKFCMNYSPAVPEEHAFMYYVTYNIVLLDIYQAEQYTEFATPFLKNIVTVSSMAR